MSRNLAFVLACALLPVIAACAPTGDAPMAAEPMVEETEKPASLEPSM